jgi:VanZ family protein
VTRLLFLTIALIVYGSLYPWHFDFGGAPRHPLLVLLDSWPSVWDRFALRDAAINLLLYLPFGATAVWTLSRRFPGVLAAAPVVLGGMALSISMELLQVYVPGRVCSLFDVFCNTVGTAAGATLALTFQTAPAGIRGRVSAPASPVLLLSLFAGYQLYPFFPILSQTRLFHSLDLLRAADGFSLNEVWCSAAEWFAALLMLQPVCHATVGTRLGRFWPAMGLLCLPLRMFLPGRTLALHEILGGLLACLGWILLRDRLRMRTVVWLLASAILLRELAPFHFSSSPSPFSWIPFAPTFDSERQSALVILFRKAFDYGTMVWLLGERGLSYARAGIAVAAVLAVLEGLQRYLPGRTPEITDAVLTLLLTGILWILNNFQHRQGLA